jgi:dihydrofolate reductase
LKKATPRGLLAGSPKLSAELQRLDLVDEYRFVVHPVVAGHGPFLFSGLQPSLRLKFVARDTAQIGNRGVALSPALLAHSGHPKFGMECPLLGVKRTSS